MNASDALKELSFDEVSSHNSLESDDDDKEERSKIYNSPIKE